MFFTRKWPGNERNKEADTDDSQPYGPEHSPFRIISGALKDINTLENKEEPGNHWDMLAYAVDECVGN